MQTVSSIGELIEALGGATAAGELFRTTPQAVVNWRLTGRMPARLYFFHRARLQARGITAPESLWGMVEPEAVEAAE